MSLMKKRINIDKLKDLIRINSVAVYGSTDSIYEIILKYRDPSVFFNNTEDLILSNDLLKERIKKFVKDASAFDVDTELKECQKIGVDIITCLDEDYPQDFRNISNPPLVLYVIGNLLSEKINISIVGTRHPTDYGIKHASKISYELASCGIGIVSGLARGIDTVVHKSTLKANGYTIGVIGSGLKNIYPPENKELFKKIISKGGAVISEYPISMPPFKFNFPRRNRLIAALSFATLVIEGDYNSGAMITARYALDQGKDVMALPGSVDCRQANGPNKLIKDGAYLIRNSKDVIELIPSSKLFSLDLSKMKESNEVKRPTLSKEAQNIYDIIKEKGELSADEISELTSFPIEVVFFYLFELETKGIVSQCIGRYKIVL